MNKKEAALINQTIESFVSNPENFILFRGETMTSRGGLHFTLDRNWAKNFGDTIIEGKLPLNSKIKLLAKTDFNEASSLGLVSERLVWDLMFIKGYDAILGTDFMDSSKLDVIVNPKHLDRFKS